MNIREAVVSSQSLHLFTVIARRQQAIARRQKTEISTMRQQAPA